MNFKEAYQDDLDNVFFDEDELASVHTIDGKECTVILTEIKKTDAKMSYGLMKSTLNPKETAINKLVYTLHIRDKDLTRKVTANAMINMDGKNYFVWDVSHTEGVYTITLGGHAV